MTLVNAAATTTITLYARWLHEYNELSAQRYSTDNHEQLGTPCTQFIHDGRLETYLHLRLELQSILIFSASTRVPQATSW
ncbi:hypothetical protein E2C01_091918 [Portunus trituberculatus]|uniref:Uncharacterized protein n=1 Tax=Portunus trituberculatus TaxID=210409 RepID=A0A5B7JU85_PORTR|nr:hypothetical protein [Portunus trituberculatus]